MSAVTLSVPTMGIGSTAQGTVTLAAAPTTAASITLTSSNPAVLTVSSPLSLAAGSSTATFTITGVGAGTASVTASVNGSTSQSSSVTVARVALSTMTLSTATVVGGNNVTGTVNLTASAPLGGAAVAVTASDPTQRLNGDGAGGATTATFASARLVGGTSPERSRPAMGASASATSVTKPTVVGQLRRHGPDETDTCTIGNGGNTLNCTFNGSTSTAPGNIVAWDWSYRVATTIAQTTTGPVLTNPSVDCGWLPAPPLPAGGPTFLPLVVTLKVRDDLGNVAPN